MNRFFLQLIGLACLALGLLSGCGGGQSAGTSWQSDQKQQALKLVIGAAAPLTTSINALSVSFTLPAGVSVATASDQVTIAPSTLLAGAEPVSRLGANLLMTGAYDQGSRKVTLSIIDLSTDQKGFGVGEAMELMVTVAASTAQLPASSFPIIAVDAAGYDAQSAHVVSLASQLTASVSN